MFLNPGHLKSETDRGAQPSCAMLDINAGLAKAVILDLSGTVVSEMKFTLPENDEDL
jgi:hypothetical protein